MRAIEGWGYQLHKLRHLLLDHGVGFEAVVEVEDDLADTGLLHRLEVVDDLLRTADQDGTRREALGFHVLHDIDNLDEVLVGRWYCFGIRREDAYHRFVEIADQRSAAISFLLRRLTDVQKIAAHAAPGLAIVFAAF